MFELTQEEMRRADPANIDPLDKQVMDSYAHHRFMGRIPADAAKAALNECNVKMDPSDLTSWAELHPYVRLEIAKKINNIEIGKMWNNKVSIWHLVQLVNDDRWTKCTTRLGAIKELNVLADVTFIDEKGRTRARKLGDFYAEQASGGEVKN